MERIASICKELDQASLKQLNDFISYARDQGILEEGENAEITRENVARLCEKWASMKRGVKRKTRDEVEDQVGDPRLLLEVPADVRRLFLQLAGDWDVAARLCQVNSQLGKWCREHNIWKFLLQHDFTTRMPLSDFYAQDLKEFQERFFEANPQLAGIVTLSQPDQETVEMRVDIPAWAAENSRAFVSAFALQHQLNTRPWMDNFIISPNGERIRIASSTRGPVMSIDSPQDDLVTFLRDKQWLEEESEKDSEEEGDEFMATLALEVFPVDIQIKQKHQLETFYHMWKDLGFRWRTPRPEANLRDEDFVVFDPETMTFYERDPETGKFTVAVGFRAGGQYADEDE